MVAVLLVVLVGMVAFAIDVGCVAHARTQLQATADAGALAGIAVYRSGTTATPDQTATKAEINKYVGGSAGNMPGLTVADSDIQFGYFDQSAAPGSRFSTTLNGRTPNAVRVTLRRDGSTNPRLSLSFSSLLGKTDADVLARGTSWTPPGFGLRADSPLIPYGAQIDYFNAAAGLPARASNAPGFVNVDPAMFRDNYTVGNVGTTPTGGADGVKELILFSSSQNAPGNFGSVDLGSASNGTPELIRQLLNGPNASDFAILQNEGKLASDGTLQAPVALGGDTGISNGTKSAWDSIIGQNRIVPLYSSVSGNGNNASYQIVGFAGVRIVEADLQGNPKQVWVQPTSFYSTKVTAAPPGSTPLVGVFAAPRLVLP